VSRRSLVEFRSRLAAEDPEMKSLRRVFDKIGARAIAELKVSTKEQRVDSTLIASNIFTRGRRDLFRKTLAHFLDWLEKDHPERMAQLSEPMRQWHEETKKTGWFGKADKDKANVEAARLAAQLIETVATFAKDEAVTEAEPYRLVARLVAEHCEVKDGGSDEGGSGGSSPTEFKLREKPEHPGQSLQSPYDPDAGYGHKGPGYSLHVAETCRNETTEIITDYEVLSAGESDRGQEAEAIARCPAGHAPVRHNERSTYHDKPATLHAYFDGERCRSCELRSRCIVRPPNNGKMGNFHLEVGAHLIVRDRALASQRTDAWWERYKIRSGIEATMSELKRRHGMRKLRVRRVPRVRMAVGFKIVACNVKRWLRAAAVLARTLAAATLISTQIGNACLELYSALRRLFHTPSQIRNTTAA
jgi:hypothetical protein